jgi:hypothetical protein
LGFAVQRKGDVHEISVNRIFNPGCQGFTPLRRDGRDGPS